MISETEKLAIEVEDMLFKAGLTDIGTRVAAELRRLSAELAALKAAMGEPVAFRLLDKDPTGGNDDRWIYYSREEFKPGVDPSTLGLVNLYCHSKGRVVCNLDSQ